VFRILSVHIALLTTGVLVHGFVPGDVLFSTAIPTPKSKNTNVTVSANYRGIALNAIIGKIIDLIVMNRYYDKLEHRIYNLASRNMIHHNVQYDSERVD
jgi:hypothetical protein